jgi:hypothetical protein
MNYNFIDSERSDECIGFTMMCVFCVFISGSPLLGAVKTASIFNSRVVWYKNGSSWSGKK